MASSFSQSRTAFVLSFRAFPRFVLSWFNPRPPTPTPSPHPDPARPDRAARRWTARSARLSPVPTTCSARACLLSIISSIFSSSVPAQRNLCTCTLRRWPMRKARSVAWFSTAGFHQRSKWKTWLAAVRFRPDAARLQREDEDAAGRPPPGSAPPSRSRCLLRTCRRAGTAPRGRTSPAGARCSSSPISANWVKTAPARPSARTSSSISVRRASLPERPGERAAVAQELRRVVADLLELGQRRQHLPAPLDALGLPRSAPACRRTTAS